MKILAEKRVIYRLFLCAIVIAIRIDWSLEGVTALRSI
jgi:hypothetical protein